MVFSGFQWFSVVFNGFQWFSVVFSDLIEVIVMGFAATFGRHWPQRVIHETMQEAAAAAAVTEESLQQEIPWSPRIAISTGTMMIMLV